MILAIAAVFVGAATQRIAGMGFAMMVAPFVILAFGPLQGVVLVNLCGATAAFITVFSLRSGIRWATFWWLLVSSLLGVGIGLLLVRALDVPTFQTVVGVVLILAIVGSTLVARTSLHVAGLRWTLAAGVTTGALVSSAGIGGPPMSIYAVLSRWEQRSFAATMQPYTAAISLVAVAASLLTAPRSWPSLSTVEWLLVAAAIIGGLLVGGLLSRVVSPRVGRVIVVVLALVGAVITLVSGLTGLLR